MPFWEGISHAVWDEWCPLVLPFLFRHGTTTLVEPLFISISWAMWKWPSTLTCWTSGTFHPGSLFVCSGWYVDSCSAWTASMCNLRWFVQLKEKYSWELYNELHTVREMHHIRELLNEYRTKVVTHRDRYKGVSGKVTLSYYFLNPHTRELCTPTLYKIALPLFSLSTSPLLPTSPPFPSLSFPLFLTTV